MKEKLKKRQRKSKIKYKCSCNSHIIFRRQKVDIKFNTQDLDAMFKLCFCNEERKTTATVTK